MFVVLPWLDDSVHNWPDQHGVVRMRLNAINDMSISFKDENQFLRFPIPAENVSTIWAGQNEIVAPPRRLLDHRSRVAMTAEFLDPIWKFCFNSSEKLLIWAIVCSFFYNFKTLIPNYNRVIIYGSVWFDKKEIFSLQTWL